VTGVTGKTKPSCDLGLRGVTPEKAAGVTGVTGVTPCCCRAITTTALTAAFFLPDLLKPFFEQEGRQIAH
jgi:hypothetical protein